MNSVLSYSTRKHICSLGRKTVCVVAAICMVVGLTPIAKAQNAYAAQPESTTSSWSQDIDSMLQKGNYVEGEALVVIATSNSAALVSVDEQGDATSTDVLDGNEELLTTNSNTAANALEAAVVSNAVSASENAGGNSEAAATDSSNNISVVLTHEEGMSTEELLRSLANDPRVVSACPNYISQPSDYESTSMGASNTASATSGNSETEEAQQNSKASASSSSAANSQAEASASSNASEASAGANSAAGNTDAQSSQTAQAVATAAGASEQSEGSAQNTSKTENFKPAATQQISDEAIPDLTSYQWSNKTNTSTVFQGQRSTAIEANIPEWNTGTENSAGIVAIVDSGIDYNHPDLRDSMADMSQYIDKIGGGKYGYNALTDENYDETQPMDEYGHGTHIAGIIAAQCNNYGTTGAANGAKLLACRDSGEDGANPLSAILKCYDYLSRAIDAGADIRVVINSWGTDYTYGPITLAIAELGKKGAMSVFASGNSACDLDGTMWLMSSSSISPYVVTVNCSSPDGSPSVFTCYGKESTDLYAPGAGIMSTVCQSKSVYMPSLIGAQNSAAYDTFDGNGSVVAYLGFGAQACTDANKVSDYSKTDFHFDESGSLAISGAQLKSTDRGPDGKGAKHRYDLTLKIPVTKNKLSEISRFSVTATSDKTTLPISTLYAEVGDNSGTTSMCTDPDQHVKVSPTTSWNTLDFKLSGALEYANNPEEACLVWHSDGTEDSSGEENGYVLVTYELQTDSDDLTDDEYIHLDCVGLGNQTIPYKLMSGTSMSTPLTAAAAAICSTAVDQSQSPSDRALQLAALVKSCVTEYPQFSGKCTSNGTLDLSKFTNRSTAHPAIATVTVVEGDENYIDISGSGFGTEGSVTIGGYSATPVSWSDTSIRVKAPEGLVSGKHDVTVATKNGTYTEAVVIRFTENPPDNDVPLYEETIEITDYNFANKARNARLIGLDGYLYAFIDTKEKPENDDITNGYTKWCRYNIETKQWSESYDMPTVVFPTGGRANSYGSVSPALWEGKLLLLCRGGGSELAEQYLWQYDPSTNEWTRLTNIEASIPYGAALINADGTLIAVGGSTKEVIDDEGESIETSDTSNNIWKIDMSTGERSALGTLSYARTNYSVLKGKPMQVAASGSTIYVCGGIQLDNFELKSKFQPAERLVKQADGTYKSESLANALPSVHEEYDPTYGVAANDEGGVFCALKTNSGNEDTFVVANSSSTSTPFGKRASDTALSGVNAIAYHGKLYVFGVDEFNGSFSLLRATAFETPEHPAGELGDSSVVPKPEENTEPTAETDKPPVGNDEHDKAAILAKTGDANTPLATVLLLSALAAAALTAARVRKKQH